jgi:hypothetical protein
MDFVRTGRGARGAGMAADAKTIFPAMPANTFLRRIDVDYGVAGKPER